MGALLSNYTNEKVSQAQLIPRTLTNMQLTIETLKYEVDSLKRALQSKKSEITNLQEAIKQTEATSSSSSCSGEVNVADLSDEDLKLKIKALEDVISCQKADLELMQQSSHEVHPSFKLKASHSGVFKFHGLWYLPCPKLNLHFSLIFFFFT